MDIREKITITALIACVVTIALLVLILDGVEREKELVEDSCAAQITRLIQNYDRNLETLSE